MAGVPFVFGNATTSIPLSNLDANFNNGVTIGNTTVGLGNTVTTLGNVTLTNATVSSASITDSGLTSGRAVYTGTGGLLSANANLTYDGTTFTAVNDASISGLTVGKGGGAVATNTAFGQSALQANTTASNNTAVGYQAGYSNTIGNNDFFGYQAGFSITTANGSAFFGYIAGKATTASDNTAFGFAALTANTTGVMNTAVGGGQAGVVASSLGNNTTGSYNTAVGHQSLRANTTASNNTAVGYQAGYASTGSANTFVGQNAGSSVTSGTNNTVLGASGSQTLTTGSYNLSLGFATRFSSSSISSAIIIGSGNLENNDKGSSTGYINPNGGGVYQGNNSTLWSITSDERLKKNIVDNTDGLNKITAIQVRNFEYRTADEITELEPQNAIDIKGVQLGAIAQELQAVLPDCVKTESTGVMSVDASNITWYLINAVKELNAKVTALEAQLGK